MVSVHDFHIGPFSFPSINPSILGILYGSLCGQKGAGWLKAKKGISIRMAAMSLAHLEV